MGRGAVRRAGLASLLAVALFAAGGAPLARADGDPASDYLINNQVFLTSESVAVSPADQQLLALVRTANQDGFAIRVALISTDYDLGSITALWRKPRVYADFLGIELSAAYSGRLLVVMPNGFGVNWPSHSTSAAYGSLAGIPVSGGANGVALAAQTAVRRLAAADGVTLETAQPSSGAPWLIIGIVAAAVLLAVLAFVGLPRARRRWHDRPQRAPRRRPAVSGPGRRIRLRWIVPGPAPARARGDLDHRSRYRHPAPVQLAGRAPVRSRLRPARPERASDLARRLPGAPGDPHLRRPGMP